MQEADNKKLKILIVDDEKDIVFFVSHLLKKEGYEILKGYTAAECFSIINDEVPDILLLDFILPDGNGIEICKKLKSDPRTENICILLLSGMNISEENMNFGQENCADDYINKPFENRNLLARVKACSRIKKAEAILKSGEEKYHLIFESNPLPMWVYDKESLSFLNVNNAAILQYGYTCNEYNGMSIKDIYPKDEIQEFLDGAGYLQSGLTDGGVWRHKKKDGTIIYVEIFSQGIVYEGRQAMLVSANDITHRVRLEKLLLIEKAVLELGAKEADLEDTLSLLIKKVEELSGEILCSILFVDEDEVTIRTGPSLSLPEAYNKIIDGIRIAPEVEPFGTVVTRRQKVIVADIANDPLWRNYKDVASEFGLKAYWAYPILSADNMISGIFACYYTYTKEPGKEDTGLLERVVSIAGVLIDKDKAIRRLRKSDTQLKEINKSLPAAVYQAKMEDITHPEFLFISEGVKELYGFTPQEVYEDASKVSERIHPDDAKSYRECIKASLETLREGHCDYRFLEGHDYEYKWIRDTFIPKKKNGSIIWSGTLADITDIKIAEENIRQSEVRYRTLFDKNPLSMFVCEVESLNFLQVNNATVNHFGYTLSELLSMKLTDIILPADINMMKKNLKKIKEGVDVEMIIRNIKKSKEVLYMNVLVSEILYKGKPALLKIATDITDRINYEKNIELKNIHFKELFNASPFGIVIFNKDNKVMNVNKAFENLFQFSLDDIRGKSVIESIVPRKLYQESETITHISSKKVIQIETKRQKKDGTLVDTLAVRYPIKANDQIIGYYGIYVDITERKKWEEKLRDNEERFRLIIDTALDAVIEMDARGSITGWNRQAEITFGWKRKEVLGQLLINLVIPRTYRKDLRNRLQQFLEAGDGSLKKRIEINALHKNGYEFPVEFSISRVQRKDIIYFSVFVRDITEHKVAEQKLKDKNKELLKANEELDRFVYSTSHDLRAPLTSVLGLINIAEMDMDEVKRKIYFDKIKKSIKRLDTFIQDIVHYSRNLRLEVKNEEINLNELIPELIEGLRFMDDAEKIKFNIAINNKIPFNSDKARITVLFNNLISNAIKYHNYQQDNPYINLKANVTKKEATIIIEDNGHGIPKEQQEKVFEMFYRASEKSTGSGLGLYIVKEIVDKLHGKIKLKSKLGIGSTFFITIPNNYGLVEKPIS